MGCIIVKICLEAPIGPQSIILLLKSCKDGSVCEYANKKEVF